METIENGENPPEVTDTDTGSQNGQSEAATENGQDSLRNIDLLLDVPLQITVEVGRRRMPVKDLLQMREGYVLELNKMAGEPLDVYVNSRLIARGEAVMVDDKLGLRLTDVVSPAERIEQLG